MIRTRLWRGARARAQLRRRIICICVRGLGKEWEVGHIDTRTWGGKGGLHIDFRTVLHTSHQLS